MHAQDFTAGTPMRVEIANEGLKAAPPVTITALAWMNALTLNEVVALATIGYIVLQSAFLIWKWWREYRKGKET